jgi:hypothetical protein
LLPSLPLVPSETLPSLAGSETDSLDSLSLSDPYSGPIDHSHDVVTPSFYPSLPSLIFPSLDPSASCSGDLAFVSEFSLVSVDMSDPSEGMGWWNFA